MQGEEFTEAELLALELEKRSSERTGENSPEPDVTLLTFYLGDDWFGILLEQIKVVARMLEVTQVPGASTYILGVVNYRSAIYPLIDLHKMFELIPSLPTRASRIVIINHEHHPFGILVDSTTEVKHVRQSELNRQVESSSGISNYINAEISLDSKMLGVLNIEAILRIIADADQS
jgi:purine-binding chemotaxis protein CheW